MFTFLVMCLRVCQLPVAAARHPLYHHRPQGHPTAQVVRQGHSCHGDKIDQWHRSQNLG